MISQVIHEAFAYAFYADICVLFGIATFAYVYVWYGSMEAIIYAVASDIILLLVYAGGWAGIIVLLLGLARHSLFSVMVNLTYFFIEVAFLFPVIMFIDGIPYTKTYSPYYKRIYDDGVMAGACFLPFVVLAVAFVSSGILGLFFRF